MLHNSIFMFWVSLVHVPVIKSHFCEFRLCVCGWCVWVCVCVCVYVGGVCGGAFVITPKRAGMHT